ncbi:PREDICTED: coiled-coil domain-containing protein 93-like [Priapulus caudatus]|uniref:Coiled-coil domain-containing protein 93 n=1 Tax=Priapulus caudatus TaxID=37621 RepID=A0ABM1E9V7_PRICU|nr:PREDICTED: coiled-coil domain-containing protein 93-like [Priapulus caudatus]
MIDKQLGADRDKLQKIRLLLARKNRDVATLQRQIDEVPTRAELSQYQRRFVELYNQVGSKHTETKQFYTLYNTLDDTRLYLDKEANLLNSIHDNFEHAAERQRSSNDLLRAQAKWADLKQKYEDAEREVQKARDYHTRLHAEIAALADVENSENKEVLQKLRDLVATNENLKKQEQEFRANCKKEMARLQENIEVEQLKLDSGKDVDEDQVSRNFKKCSVTNGFLLFTIYICHHVPFYMLVYTEIY